MFDELMDARMDDFETERLRVTHWRRALEEQADVLRQDLQELLSDAVVQYLPDSLALSGEDDAIDDWIDERDSESIVYLVESRADGAFLGLLLLAPATEDSQDDGDEDDDRGEDSDDARSATLHIGFLFQETAWGQGYASELVAGVMDGLEEIGNPRVRAGVARDNDASARVLFKNGFALNEALSTADGDIFEA